MIININRYYLKLIFILVKILQQQKLIKKGVDRDIIFEIIRQKSLEKKLNCKFILNYDYELGNIHTFIDEFENNKIK